MQTPRSSLDHPPGKAAAPAWLLISGCLTAVLAVWICLYSRHGIDYTDEGFYLNWISNPFLYPASVSQFGFFYHPLYMVADGSIAGIRRLNFLLTFLLGLAASWNFLGLCFGAAMSRIARLTVSAALATLTLLTAVFNGMWIPTPSYNSLAFQGLLVAATGVFVGGRRAASTSASASATVFGGVLIGLGGWITFLGKPTSAAALGALVLVYFVLSGSFGLRAVLIAAGTAVLAACASVWLIDGNIHTFIERNLQGLKLARLLGMDDGIGRLFRVDGVPITAVSAGCMLAGAVMAFFTAHAAEAPTGMPAPMYVRVLPIASLLAACALAWFFLGSVIPGDAKALVLFSLAAGAGLSGLWGARGRLSRKDVALLVMLLGLPYAYAFGSSNNYWVSMGGAFFFVALAALSVCKPMAQQPGLHASVPRIALAFQVGALVVIHGAFSSPYRQALPLHEATLPVEVGGRGNTLLLSPADRDYLESMKTVAANAGFQPRTPMIDLTGNSPGAIYALQASGIGVPWSLGGYPGSQKYLQTALGPVSCDQLAAAWVLSEDGRAGAIAPEILADFGADLQKDYDTAGSFPTPRKTIQQLHKPRDASQGAAACRRARQVNP